ncbi:hypothetical protein ACJMK2_033058 [Sinanodonta woodiana]|uniref:Death domain-containing protein n=1 Tax=Sinanodonta woodiana TaxID=1069815 RepID=A0ABD3X778_SINWO
MGKRKAPPCSAKKDRFYNGGRFCSKCDICPGGHGRDMSKQVLNRTETQGDLECIKCTKCPPQTYNNGGRDGCKKCLENCADRNRHDCPEKATQLCGDCFHGHYEAYSTPDNPSTCIPCTAKEIPILPACADLTTITPSHTEAQSPDTTLLQGTVSDTTVVGAKTTRYLYIPNGAPSENGHVFGKNNSSVVQNDTLEAKHEKTPGGDGLWLLILSVCIILILAVLLIIWMIRCYKKRRRRRQSRSNEKTSTVMSSNTPLMIGTSQSSVEISLPESLSENKEDLIVIFDDLGSDNDIETDSKPVPKEMDHNRWCHRQELLKSKVAIHLLCAKRWITLDKEFWVLSLSEKDVQLLEKEADNRCWPPEELNFKILAKWTQVKGNQATVQALCDALFTSRQYDIIEDILKENP